MHSCCCSETGIPAVGCTQRFSIDCKRGRDSRIFLFFMHSCVCSETGIPAVGCTQRSSIDCKRGEIHIFFCFYGLSCCCSETGIPAVGCTQRSSIDCKRGEIHVFFCFLCIPVFVARRESLQWGALSAPALTARGARFTYFSVFYAFLLL
jgi:hypothetical protein